MAGATAVDQAAAELDATAVAVAPIFEGLQDYDRLNLQDRTHEVVRRAIADYQRRFDLIRAAYAALAALLADGYPARDIREVEDAVYQDLQANAATIEAALATFSSGSPITLTMAAGPAQRKGSA